MSFISNVVNSIPVVGAINAAALKLSGDDEGAAEALRTNARSTAVLAGGLVGGPFGAMGAGAAMDAAISLEKDEPTGVFNGLNNMGKDISNGKIPVMSTLETVANPLCDAMTGQAASSLMKSAAKEGGKTVLKQEAKRMVVSNTKGAARNLVIERGKKAMTVMMESKDVRAAVACGVAASTSDCVESHARIVRQVIELNRNRPRPTSGGSPDPDQPGPSPTRANNSSRNRSTANRSTTNRSASNTSTSNTSSTNRSTSNRSTSNRSTSNTDRSTASSDGPPNNPPRRNLLPTESLTKDELEQLVEEILNVLKKARYFPGRQNYEYNRLKMLLTMLINKGYDARILVIAVHIANRFNVSDDIMKFSSLTETIIAYVGDRVLELTSEYPNMTVDEIRQMIVFNLMNGFPIHDPTVADFQQFFYDLRMRYRYGELTSLDELTTYIERLRNMIESEPGHSYFRDEYMALYHWYKHRRFTTEDGDFVELTISQYFQLIERIFNEVRQTTAYQNLRRSQRAQLQPGERVPFIRYRCTIRAYGRYHILVIKLQNGRIVVSSCYCWQYEE